MGMGMGVKYSCMMESGIVLRSGVGGGERVWLVSWGAGEERERVSWGGGRGGRRRERVVSWGGEKR